MDYSKIVEFPIREFFRQPRSLLGPGAHKMVITDMSSEQAPHHASETYANPHDFEAMSGMVWAQYIAAQAFSASLLGILHSLSHAVCADIAENLVHERNALPR